MAQKIVTVRSLKRGDETPWYKVVSPCRKRRNGTGFYVTVRYHDGIVEQRDYFSDTARVPRLTEDAPLSPAELHEVVAP